MIADLALVGSWKKAQEHDISCVTTEVKNSVEIPAVIILSGVVGAGKTTFAKNFLVKYQIVSPTYSIINEVDDLLHADFFRLKSASEFEHLELGLYSEDKNYVLIEWGMDYLNEIQNELGDSFNYYQLRIELGESLADRPDRNYYLEHIS